MTATCSVCFCEPSITSRWCQVNLVLANEEISGRALADVVSALQT
jgi:hypothetical protein